MKGVTSWDFHPYLPPMTENGGIYICRIAPSANAIHAEWLDAGASTYTVTYGKRDGDEKQTITVSGTECDITGLEEGADYEIAVSCENKYSNTRLVKTACNSCI